MLPIRSVIYNSRTISIIYLNSGATTILVRKHTFRSISEDFISLQMKTLVSDICHVITLPGTYNSFSFLIILSFNGKVISFPARNFTFLIKSEISHISKYLFSRK